MSTAESLRHKAGTVEENTVRIDTDNAGQSLEALITNITATYGLYLQLCKHYWTIEEPEFDPHHDWFGDAAEDTEHTADELAGQVQALVGVPISGPRSLKEHASVEFEGGDVYNVRTSIENDLEMSGGIIDSMREHVSLTEDLGDYATSELLRETLEVFEKGAHVIESKSNLEDGTLVLEEATH